MELKVKNKRGKLAYFIMKHNTLFLSTFQLFLRLHWTRPIQNDMRADHGSKSLFKTGGGGLNWIDIRAG